MPFSVRKELLGAGGTVHGGLDYAKLRSEGVEPESILDFSVSTNPLPPHPEVERAVARAAFERYPDSSSGALRRALAEANGLSPDEALVTNGLAQAIFLLAFAFCDRGSRVLVASPAFGEYEAASGLAGAEVLFVPARVEEGFAFPAERLMQAVRAHRPALVWVCSPNNPTGAAPSREEAASMLRVCEDEGALLLLDEAYVNFAPPGVSARALLPSPNLLLLRSMTKDYGLTGLRLGYILGATDLLRPLRALQPPWSVNACAQAAGEEALRRNAYYEARWREVRSLTGALAAKLRALGYAPTPPSANFILFYVGDTAALKEFLWGERILVRDCASFGLPGYVRVGVRSEEENERLLECLFAFKKR